MTTPTRRSAVTGLAALAGCAAPLRSAPPAPPRPPPPPLAARLQAIAADFGGRYGLSIRDVEAGWTASHDGRSLYPQQSIAKLWTALAVFDAVDCGRFTLADVVHVTAADMSVFHQPIRARLVDGALDVTLDDLLVGALAQSDNACEDILARRVGGSRAVQQAVDLRRLGAIRAGPEERYLQSFVAGLTWRPEYAEGDAFEQARAKLDPAYRQARLAAYLADPPEGAAPDALTEALARLVQGELLSSASTARFMAILASTTTGPMRLKAGLPPGWSFAHKTGTGQDLGAVSTGYNDAGVVTAPDGGRFTVAAMMASTQRPIPERMAAMQEVTKALAAWRAGTLV